MYYKNLKYHFFGIIVCIAFLLTSCNTKPDTCANAKELVEEIKPQIAEITTEQYINDYQGSAKDYILIDVRQSTEFENGNIEGAINLPRGILEFKINDALFWEDQMMYPPTDSTEILIYCKKGSRGTLATAALKELGYKKVKNLTGGYLAYQEVNQDAEEE